MAYLHEDLASGRWFTLSLAEQMGNVGSEVERAISWQKKENPARFTQATERLLELLDLTIADQRWIKQHRLRELVRVREALCDLFYGDNQYQSKPADWQKYFLYFGILARSQR